MNGQDLLEGRKKIRAVVPVSWKLESIYDYQLAAVEAMKKNGAADIRDFKEIKPLPKDHQRFGKTKIRVFSATAVRTEAV